MSKVLLHEFGGKSLNGTRELSSFYEKCAFIAVTVTFTASQCCQYLFRLISKYSGAFLIITAYLSTIMYYRLSTTGPDDVLNTKLIKRIVDKSSLLGSKQIIILRITFPYLHGWRYHLKNNFPFAQKWAKSASLGKRGTFCSFLVKPRIIFLIRMVNKLVLQFETCPGNWSKNIEK